jgi:hypothetical protein
VRLAPCNNKIFAIAVFFILALTKPILLASSVTSATTNPFSLEFTYAKWSDMPKRERLLSSSQRVVILLTARG